MSTKSKPTGLQRGRLGLCGPQRRQLSHPPPRGASQSLPTRHRRNRTSSPAPPVMHPHGSPSRHAAKCCAARGPDHCFPHNAASAAARRRRHVSQNRNSSRTAQVAGDFLLAPYGLLPLPLRCVQYLSRNPLTTRYCSRSPSRRRRRDLLAILASHNDYHYNDNDHYCGDQPLLHQLPPHAVSCTFENAHSRGPATAPAHCGRSTTRCDAGTRTPLTSLSLATSPEPARSHTHLNSRLRPHYNASESGVQVLLAAGSPAGEASARPPQW